jgi:hypothetical protein
MGRAPGPSHARAGRIACLGALYRPSGKSADLCRNAPGTLPPQPAVMRNTLVTGALLCLPAAVLLTSVSLALVARRVPAHRHQVGHVTRAEDRDLSHAANSEPPAGRCAGVA